MATRICVELGLYREENVVRNFPDAKQRDQAMVIFLCVYMLDRRGCIGLGVPYILQDCDVDAALPESTSDLSLSHDGENGVSRAAQAREASRQYMIAMIDFTRLSGKAYGIVNRLIGKRPDFPREEIDYLDYQVLQWHQNLPHGLQLSRNELRQLPTDQIADSVPLFLRAVLNVRFYQLRNLMFRPALYSPSRISSNFSHARTAIDVAKESVLFLCALNESTIFIRSQPVFFKHFLISAFGVLLLAMVNAWKELGHLVSHEFYLALDLFKIMSVESPLIMRYWKAINGLEELAHKVGLSRPQVHPPPTQDQISNAAWSISNPPPPNGSSSPDSNVNTQMDFNMNPIDPAEIRTEFATFFDPGAGYTSSLFDFPLSDMFSTDLLGP
jgi:hypothetical protein